MKPLTIVVSASVGNVDGLLLRPQEAKWLLVLARGAGAGMQHPFMDRLAHELAGRGVATLRYQFPYMQHRRGRPDLSGVLTATVRAAVAAASAEAPDLSLLAGGKSFGGRMTSLAFAGMPSAAPPGTADVRGLVFFGFPLHSAGRPSIQRAEHLAKVDMPMLFLQGTRDALADLSLLRPVCAELGPRASLHVIEGADHSFHVLKRSGRRTPRY
ncbi:MAG TPA: alpha/beta family hydrolase [Nitrospira sp.]|nr:alpha/beta family hydrolase [Nitrospira sp.]